MYQNQTLKRSSSLNLQRNQKLTMDQRPKSEIIDSKQQKVMEIKDITLYHKILESTIRITNTFLRDISFHERNTAFGQWNLSQVWDKRKIKGTNSTIKWIHKQSETQFNFKLSLPDSYRNNMKSDIFLQIVSSNIKFSIVQLKDMQKIVDIKLQQYKHQEGNDYFTSIKLGYLEWLKDVLVYINDYFAKQKICSRQKNKTVQNFIRREINPNYMLFPSQACLSWNPDNMLCLIDQKPILYPRPIIGTLESVRTHLQNQKRKQRFAQKSREDDQIDNYQQKREQLEQSTNFNVYQWKIQEQIKFIIFKSADEDQNSSPLQKKLIKNKIDDENVKNQSNNKKFEVSIPYPSNNKNTKMLSLLKRNFCNTKNCQIPRQAKIKIYMLRNKSSRLQDNMIYLYQKIHNQYDGKSLIRVLLKRQLKKQSNIFTNNFLTNLKLPLNYRILYESVKRILRTSINNSSQPSLFYLKAILLQNECLHSIIESYFIQNFKGLKICPPFDLNMKLGSYMHFNDVLAEEWLMFMLECYFDKKFGSLEFHKNAVINQYYRERYKQQNIKNAYKKNPNKFDDPLYSQKKKYKNLDRQHNQNNSSSFVDTDNKLRPLIEQSYTHQQLMQMKDKRIHALNRNANANPYPKFIMKIYQIYPLKYEPILNTRQKQYFLKNQLIPILIYMSHSLDGPQQILIKKALIANAKIINFIQKMNKLANKFIQKKFNFIQQLIIGYRKYTQKFQNNRQIPRNTKNFYGVCRTCSQPHSLFNMKKFIQNINNKGQKQQLSDQNFYEKISNKPIYYCEKCKMTQQLMSPFQF